MRPDRPQNLTQALIWFSSSYGFAILGYLAVNALVARELGAERFGYFVVINTAALFVGQIALLGIHRSGLREAARVTDRNDPALVDLREDVGVVERTTLLGLSVLSGVAAGVVVSGSLSDRLAIGVATASLVAASAQQQLWACFLRGFGETRLAGLMEGRSGGALVAITQAALLFTLSLLSARASLAAVVTASAVGYLLPTVAARLMVTRRWSGLARSGVPPLLRLTKVLRRDWKFVVISTSTSANQNVEIWMAGAFLTAQDSSFFSAGMRLAMQLLLAGLAIQVVFTPAVSRLWAKGDQRRLEQLLRTGASMATVILIVGWVPMLIAPQFVMSLLFGSEFAAAASLLVVLSAGSAINVLTGLCGTALTMTGHESAPAFVGGLTLAGRLIVGFVALQAFGVMGLAVSSVTFSALLNLSLFLFTLKKLHLNTLPALRPHLRLLKQTDG